MCLGGTSQTQGTTLSGIERVHCVQIAKSESNWLQGGCCLGTLGQCGARGGLQLTKTSGTTTAMLLRTLCDDTECSDVSDKNDMKGNGRPCRHVSREHLGIAFVRLRQRNRRQWLSWRQVVLFVFRAVADLLIPLA